MRRARNTQTRAQFRSGFGRGLRCALAASGCEHGRDTRKSAQFRSGFWRCLRRALVASECENGRTTRKSWYFVRPCALANTDKDCVKKRAKNAKNGRVKIDVYVCLWAKMSPTPVSNAQFRNGFWRCLLRALVASGCENERTTRKSAYFVRPCALAKIQNGSFKKRAKNAKNGGVKIAFR